MEQVAIATVKLIAQSLGITKIKESSFIRIIDSTQMQIMHTLSYSVQILMSTKRTKLTAEDINLSLRTCGNQPLFGYFSGFSLENAGVIDSLEIFVYLPIRYQPNQITAKDLPPYPLETYFEFDWIAKNGSGKVIATEKPVQETEKKDSKTVLTEESSLTLEDSAHSITHELHVFYSTAKKDLNSNNPFVRETILYFLNQNRCIQVLIPYFIRYSMVLTKENLTDDQLLSTALNVLLSLSMNSDLNLINYSHLLLDSALTFLISPLVRPPNIIEFRDRAAEFLNVLNSILYGYPRILVSLVSQLTAVLENSEQNWIERYGAFVGLAALGSDTISHCTSFLVSSLAAEIKAVIDGNDSENIFLVRILQDKIISAVGMCFYLDTVTHKRIDIVPHELKSAFNYQSVVDSYGYRVLEYCFDSSSLLTY